MAVPGGVLELGEKLRDGVAREALEETGLTVEVGEVLDVFDSIFPDADGRAQYHFVLIDFLCRPISGEAIAASDVSEVKWVTESDLAALNLRPTVAQVLRIHPDSSNAETTAAKFCNPSCTGVPHCC